MMLRGSVPSFNEISHIVTDEGKCIEWLFEHRVLQVLSSCELCGNSVSRQGKRFRCTKFGCRKSVSIFKVTFFAESKLKCSDVMHLAYLWLTNCTSDTILTHTGHSSATVTAYNAYFRQVVANM